MKTLKTRSSCSTLTCSEKEEDNNDVDDYSQVNEKEKDDYELEDDFMSDFESDEEEFSTLFSCNICEASNMTIEEFISHTKRHTREEKQIALEKLVNIRLSNDIATKNAAAAYGFKLHLSLESSVPLYLCTVCGQGNLLLKNLQDHSNLHPHFTDSHYCNLCEEQFPDGSTLAAHLETHLDNNDLTCQYCNRRFSIIDDLELHENTHYQAEYVCAECRQNFKSKELVLAHLKKFHSTCNYCHICDQEFSTEYLIDNHFMTHSTINVIKRIVKSFACDFCAKKYDSKISLQRHILFLHNDRMPFICEYCGFTAYHEDPLREHLEIEHSNSDTSMCSKCGLLFNTKSSLDSHMVLHKEENSYTCKHCGIHLKKFKKLKYHLASHGDVNSSELVFDSDEDVIGSENDYSQQSSEKDCLFICNYCDQVFSTEDTYHDHLKYHQYYTCDLCKKLFESELFLNIHLNKVHTSKFCKPDLNNSVFPFKCNKCNSSFRLEFELEDHSKTHGSDKYQCYVCFKEFTIDKELQGHLKTHKKSQGADTYTNVETTESSTSEGATQMETDIVQ